MFSFELRSGKIMRLQAYRVMRSVSTASHHLVRDPLSLLHAFPGPQEIQRFAIRSCILRSLLHTPAEPPGRRFLRHQIQADRRRFLFQFVHQSASKHPAKWRKIMKLDFKFPEWEPQYKAALLEVDRAKLLERVAAAEAAIRQRMRAIFGRTDGDMERQAIGKALSALSVLKETSFS